jgi:hypothetical protein
MKPEEQHFIDTLRELRERMAKGDRYELIKASGLLRLLLLDGGALVHIVNRHHRVKIDFETIDYTMKLPTLSSFRVHMHWTNLDATGFPPAAKRITSKLDPLLAAIVVTFEGEDYSVADIIRSAAHLKGGVHYGAPDNDRDKKLLEADKLWAINNVDASLAAMRGLVAVVLRGLKPLEDAITNATGLTTGGSR